MAVLSKPVNVSFEIAKDKTSAFFNRNNENAFQRAIARSEKHASRATKVTKIDDQTDKR